MNSFANIKDLVLSRSSGLWSRFSAMPKRQKNLFILTLAVLGIWFVFYGIAKPIQQSVLGVSEQISFKEKLATRNIKDASQKTKIDSIYSNLIQSIGMSPEGSEEVRASMLHDIDSFARSHNVSLTEIKPQVSSEHDRFVEFFVRTQAEGSTKDVFSFFNELLKAKKLYYIDSLRMTPHPEDVNKIKASVSIGRTAIIRK